MKNVILITMDAVRPDHLGCYGYERPITPNLDFIAKHGIIFKNVIATSCLTPVAHASILSGKNPDKTDVRDPFCKVNTKLISEILKEHGYKTAGFVGIDFLSKKHGFDRGFDYFDEPTKETGWNSKKYHKDEQEMDTIWGNWWIPRMLNWIKLNKDKPFFIWGHYFKVHFHAEEQMLKDGLIKEGKYSENGYYDAKIKYMDENLFNPLIRLLKILGIWDNTIIVVTSDHGESFQYKYPQHRTLRETDLKIPLIIMDSGMKYHRIIEYTVRSIDIVPTILDLVGIMYGNYRNERIDGVSLIPLSFGLYQHFRKGIAYSEELFENRGEGSLQSFRTDNLKIIINRTKGTIEVYDLIEDPHEMHNLADERYYSYQRTKTEEEKIKKSITRLGFKKVKTPEDAINLLGRKIRNSKYIENKQKFFNHAMLLSMIVDETLSEIRSNNQEVDIDSNEMLISAILHDIGNCISGDRLHHPIIGADYLELIEGLPRIAKIIRTHNFIKEIVEETRYKDISPKDLDIKTWNEALITHASMICGSIGKITFDEKLSKQRKNRDNFFLKISKKGEKRIREIYEDVEKLKKGDKKIVSKYEVL